MFTHKLVSPLNRIKSYQLSFGTFGPINDAIKSMAESSGDQERGAIFTRIEVVEFILDLVGYTTEKPLHQLRLLEPAVGVGDFLIPAIKRLIKSWKHYAGDLQRAEIDLSNAIRAVELHQATYIKVQKETFALLVEEGVEQGQANRIANSWLAQDDFLLAEVAGSFQFIVGNPPYVRQELIPDVLLREYRMRYHTVYDRADLYIPFIERSLGLLETDGHLGFICADRWMKNRYGGPLRKFVSDNFHLKFYIDMTDAQAFQSDVSAYPAITVFTRKTDNVTRIAHRPKIESNRLSELAAALTSGSLPDVEPKVTEVVGIVSGSEPWILDSSYQLPVIRRLESRFPLLEEAGCKVGIGVATGLDKVFIKQFDELNIESDRKIPLVMTRDIQGDVIEWSGSGVINPFDNDGSLVDLKAYPLLEKYLVEHKSIILKRHVASRNPNSWYRTIDRIYPEIAKRPKLLIPDIKGAAKVVYEDGRFYPHHNLYYITSDDWDLRALQIVLQSGIAGLFVSTYSTKMRGGYLRFQAQYMRRIRIPRWKDVPEELKFRLSAAMKSSDLMTCYSIVFDMYELSNAERGIIGRNDN